MMHVGDILSYRGGCSVLWRDIMISVGISWYGGSVQYRGGYHEYRGVILSTVGDLLLFEYPHDAEHPPRYS